MENSNPDGGGVLVHPVLGEKERFRTSAPEDSAPHYIQEATTPHTDPLSRYFPFHLGNSYDNDPFGPISVPVLVPQPM